MFLGAGGQDAERKRRKERGMMLLVFAAGVPVEMCPVVSWNAHNVQEFCNTAMRSQSRWEFCSSIPVSGHTDTAGSWQSQRP